MQVLWAEYRYFCDTKYLNLNSSLVGALINGSDFNICFLYNYAILGLNITLKQRTPIGSCCPLPYGIYLNSVVHDPMDMNNIAQFCNILI